MNPITFMMGVMGANLFWASYAVLTLVVSALLIKKFMPVTYKFWTKGEKEAEALGRKARMESFDKPMSGILTLVVIITWPGWVALLTGFGLLWILSKLGGVIIRAAFTLIDKAIPSVDIKVKKSPSSLEQR